MKNKLYIASIIYLIILLLLMILPLGGSSVKMNNTMIIGFRGDYFLHMFVYTPWMLVGQFLLNDNFKRLYWLFLGVIVAVGLEFVQMILPYRGFNINDIIFSVLGVLISVIFHWMLKNKS